LLKRLLGWAVKTGKLRDNPLRGVQLLRKPNVRRMVVDEDGFQRLSERRKRRSGPSSSSRSRRHAQGGAPRALLGAVDIDASTMTLAPEDAKTDEPRLIVLTTRAKEAR